MFHDYSISRLIVFFRLRHHFQCINATTEREPGRVHEAPRNQAGLHVGLRQGLCVRAHPAAHGQRRHRGPRDNLPRLRRHLRRGGHTKGKSSIKR